MRILLAGLVLGLSFISTSVSAYDNEGNLTEQHSDNLNTKFDENKTLDFVIYKDNDIVNKMSLISLGDPTPMNIVREEAYVEKTQVSEDNTIVLHPGTYKEGLKFLYTPLSDENASVEINFFNEKKDLDEIFNLDILSGYTTHTINVDGEKYTLVSKYY